MVLLVPGTTHRGRACLGGELRSNGGPPSGVARGHRDAGEGGREHRRDRHGADPEGDHPAHAAIVAGGPAIVNAQPPGQSRGRW